MPHPHLAAVPPGGPMPPIGAAAAIPRLQEIRTPTIIVALPDGSQARIPGTIWPQPDIWAASDRRTRAGAPPAIEVRQLTRKESNVLCAAWHPLGAERRPFGYHAFALFVKGQPIALATAGSAHSASVDKELGLNRRNTIELTRLCRAPQDTHPHAKGSLRVMLRLWRDLLAVPYYPYFEDTEKVALISYSLPGKAGNVYRTDGWTRLRACRPWGGGSNWSVIPDVPPTALFAYWLPGRRPANAASVLEHRHREKQAPRDGHRRSGIAQQARTAA